MKCTFVIFSYHFGALRGHRKYAP